MRKEMLLEVAWAMKALQATLRDSSGCFLESTWGGGWREVGRERRGVRNGLLIGH